MPSSKKDKHSQRKKIVVATLLVWGILSAIWSVLLWPTMVLWLHSTAWIVVMSWWANVASSAANFTVAYLMWLQFKEGE